MRSAGLARAEIGSRLLPPHMQFKLDALLEGAGRWSEAELQSALRLLDRADRRIKRGSEPASELVLAVAEACRGSEQAADGANAAISRRRAR
jgi:DNA polymerase III delta subunit